jgi:hypothetical protein
MLSSDEQVDGNRLMLKLIKELAGNNNALVASGKFVISAKVRGELIIDDELFECQFTKKLDTVNMSVYWEEGGYRNYKALGLFGLMETNWQKVRRKDGVLYIENPGKSYELRIKLRDDEQ